MIYRSKHIKFVAWGDFACFTKPEFRSDRVTNPIITPTAAEGLCRAIHWHPESDIHGGEPSALGVEISEIWVLNPIRTTAMRMNEVGELPVRDKVCVIEPRQTSVVLVRDPKYLIEFQYVARSSQALVDKNETIFRRRLRTGQCFMQPYFGRRRYPAFFREAEPGDRPIDVDLELGQFPWRIEYDGIGRDAPRWLHTFNARLRRGVLAIPSYLDAMETAGRQVAL